MNQEKREELAWAAGFFDGEGSTVILKKNHNVSVRMAVTQKHTHSLSRFHEAVGVGKVYIAFDHDGISRWQTTNHEDTLKAAEMLWPWLGAIKRAQFTRVMNKSTWHNGIKDKLVCKNPNHTTKLRSNGGRRCVECSREYHRIYARAYRLKQKLNL